MAMILRLWNWKALSTSPTASSLPASQDLPSPSFPGWGVGSQAGETSNREVRKSGLATNLTGPWEGPSVVPLSPVLLENLCLEMTGEQQKYYHHFYFP